MAERLVTEVRARSTDVPGRSLVTARTHHFVIDGPAFHGGPNEAIVPSEAFLSGVLACGVLLLEHFAREEKLPLRRTEGRIAGIRLKSDPATFEQIDLAFDLTGVTGPQAEQLVEKFKSR